MESCASSLDLIVSVSAFLAWWCRLLPCYIITTFFASPRGKCDYLMEKNRIWFRMIQIQFTHDGKNKTQSADVWPLTQHMSPKTSYQLPQWWRSNDLLMNSTWKSHPEKTENRSSKNLTQDPRDTSNPSVYLCTWRLSIPNYTRSGLIIRLCGFIFVFWTRLWVC